MHFSWPLFRNHVDLLNSCFTSVLEQEMLKILSELDLNHTVGGRERKKQHTRREKKKLKK